jgi:hypothetical protein
MLELLLKLAVGTAAFAIYRRWAKGAQPSKAGMMLTFPALNGMALAMTGSSGVTTKAASMFPMICLNGALCLALLAALDARPRFAQRFAVPIAFAALGLWLLVAWLAPSFTLQWQILAIAIFLGAALFTSHRYAPLSPVEGLRDATSWWRDAWLWRFCALLGCLLVIGHAFADSHEMLGKAGALPLLPLIGMTTQMKSGQRPSTNQTATILFGPVIAMVYVLVVAWVLDRTDLRAIAGHDWLADTAFVLVPAWGACIGAILLVARALEGASRPKAS